MGERRQQQLLQFFNPYAVRIISIHEVYPGPLCPVPLAENALRSKARKLEPSLKMVGTNCEGWAHYCEEMMLEQGYGEGDPDLLLLNTQLQAALIQLCRYIVAIRMHTQGMTLDEAASFFQTKLTWNLQTRSVKRRAATFDPGYLDARARKARNHETARRR